MVQPIDPGQNATMRHPAIRQAQTEIAVATPGSLLENSDAFGKSRTTRTSCE